MLRVYLIYYMKFKLIALAYIFILGSFSFSDQIFLSGGLSTSVDAGLTGFDSRTVKLQPEITSDAFFLINFNEIFKTGLSAGLTYTFSSNLNEGWSYPGFSGFETGLELRAAVPFVKSLEIGAGGFAGWYKYNLTENFFFLPSVEVYPAFQFYNSKTIGLFIEAPVRYYFHKQADIFMSAGLKLRMVLK